MNLGDKRIASRDSNDIFLELTAKKELPEKVKQEMMSVLNSAIKNINFINKKN